MGYCSYTYYGQRDEVVKLWYSYTYPNPNPNPNPDPNPTPNQVGLAMFLMGMAPGSHWNLIDGWAVGIFTLEP